MKRALFVLVCALLVNCGVSIDTGPSTPAESARLSQDEAGRIKKQWMDQLRGASTNERVRLLQQLVDSTGASYLRIGERIADEWHNGELGRKASVPVEEMQQLIDRSTGSQVAVMRAYEEIAEQALSLLSEDQFARADLIQAAQSHVNRLYETNSAVFYPQGDRQAYLSRIVEVRSRLEEGSRELSEVIARQ